MKQFLVKFQDQPELICQLDDTDLANRYYDLLYQQYHEEPDAIFRDQQRYDIPYFLKLAHRANSELGWNWFRDHYDLSVTTVLHKQLEQYLAQGYENIPERHDELLNELHFALHAIESGSQRNNWLQIEWYNDKGFAITEDEYPGKITLDFGDIRLQNPYVGHHPLYLYQQRDSINIIQTCRFHDFAKPGINLTIVHNENLEKFDQSHYLDWFRTYGADFLKLHSESTLLKYTGHPVVGRIINLDDLQKVVDTPKLFFERLVF